MPYVVVRDEEGEQPKSGAVPAVFVYGAHVKIECMGCHQRDYADNMEIWHKGDENIPIHPFCSPHVIERGFQPFKEGG